MKLFDFDNSYVRLSEIFYRRQLPELASAPCLIAFNHALAHELRARTEGVSEQQLAEIFAGNTLPEGAEPIALAYAGHQFGHFVPWLGDGRAILVGEVVDANGMRRDIQLKGSGITPFSRRGDGKAAIGPVIREYIVSEAMHALGICTTRSLAAVVTGDIVYRETGLQGAVITRVAASHIRIGTFEYFAARGDKEAVKRLADYVIDRHYPEARNAANPYAMLLESVMEAQAKLVASWMHVGFIHGVMNTDNMAVSGETIDYGPCAFMDEYDPMKVFSSIDRHGRYAFSNQPAVAQWNLDRLAEVLAPWLDKEAAKAVKVAKDILAVFPNHFHRYWLAGMRRKLGLFTQTQDDEILIDAWLKLMHKNSADYTLAFRALCTSDGAPLLELFADKEGIREWITRWRERQAQEPQSAQERENAMRQNNPVYIPRNHRIEQVIQAAVQQEDFLPMERLRQVLANPYQEREGFAEFALPPLPSERVTKTFCGT